MSYNPYHSKSIEVGLEVTLRRGTTLFTLIRLSLKTCQNKVRVPLFCRCDYRSRMLAVLRIELVMLSVNREGPLFKISGAY